MVEGDEWYEGPGWYYIRLDDDNVEIDYCYGDYWESSWVENIKEVLAPVPSWEEFKKFNKVLGGLE